MLTDHLTDEQDDTGIQQYGTIGIHLGAQGDGETGNLLRNAKFFFGYLDVDGDGGNGTTGG